MAKREVIYQGLIDLPVLISDNTVNSPDFFRITKLPTEFTAGINVFEFKGNPSLFKEGTHIYVEILDSNGNPVYYESNLNIESESQSAIISVYIESDVAPGPAIVSIVSTAYIDASGRPLNTTFRNVRWSTIVTIDPSKRNAAEVTFKALPEVTIFSSTGSYTNLGYPGGNKFATSGVNNLQYYFRNSTALLFTSSVSTVGFDNTSLSSTIQIPYDNLYNNNPTVPGQILSGSTFSASIVSISGSGVAYLSKPMQFSVFNSDSIYTPSSATIISGTIIYEQSSSLSPEITQNTHNIATAFFSGLSPQVGTIARIRSYYRSSGVGEYIVSNETDITGQFTEPGFTPDIISASFAIATVHRNDRLDFKFEFLNPYGSVSKQIVESQNNMFLGGNTYIGGTDNLLTGSLYVAGATGTGVEITGKSNSAMVRSLGYNGFQNAMHGTGSGFVLYSGSIQAILGSAESYSGVGLELVANSSSYFKYATSGSGMLDIHTSQFFLGNSSSYIQSISGSMSIYTPYFTISPLGVVTASALHVEKTNVSTGDLEIMIDTTLGILDATNLGRTLYSDMSEYSSGSAISHGARHFSGSSFIFQALPNEYRYTLSYQCRIDVTSAGSGGATFAAARLRLYPLVSGSYPSYDDIYFTSSISTTGGITTAGANVATTAVAQYDFVLSENYRESFRKVDLLTTDSIYQGKFFKGVIDFYVQNTGTPNTYTAYFKNLTVTATRGMVSSWGGGFTSSPLPSAF